MGSVEGASSAQTQSLFHRENPQLVALLVNLRRCQRGGKARCERRVEPDARRKASRLDSRRSWR